MRTLVASLEDPLRVAYLVASLLDMKAEDKQLLLEEDSLSVKLNAVNAWSSVRSRPRRSRAA